MTDKKGLKSRDHVMLRQELKWVSEELGPNLRLVIRQQGDLVHDSIVASSDMSRLKTFGQPTMPGD